jgi:hypothetical protein
VFSLAIICLILVFSHGHVLVIFSFPKIFPNGIKKISTCCSLFCVTHPMVEFLLVILRIEIYYHVVWQMVVFFVIGSFWLALIYYFNDSPYGTLPLLLPLPLTSPLPLMLMLLLSKIAIPRLPDCCQIVARLLPDCRIARLPDCQIARLPDHQIICSKLDNGL